MIAIVQVVLSFYVSLCGGLNVNISRQYFSMGRDRFSSYVSAVFFVLLLLFVVLMSFSLVYLLTERTLFGLKDSWFLAMPIVACMAMANMLNLTILRVQDRPYSYFVWEVSSGCLNLIITVVLILVFGLGWEGRAYGIIFPMMLYGVLSIFLFFKRGLISGGVFREDVRDAAGVTASLVPHTLAAVVISLIDRLFIQRFLGDSAVGVYTIGYQFGTILMLFTSSFQKAWQPWFFKRMSSNSEFDRRQIVECTWIYFVFLVLGSAIYLALAKMVLPYLIDHRYLGAMHVLLPLVLASVAYGGYQIFFPYLVHFRKTRLLMVVTPIAAGLNALLNFIYIPLYGIVGAAYATLFSYVLTFMFTAMVAIRCGGVPWMLRK